ncbi:MAG: hypothetical protein IAF00_08570, partial [Phycisphaerales bacterium]|nr:hypothetical protein [Phycisphaerales bacterium]
TVPIDNARLQGLQTMAARVLAAAQSASAKSDRQWMPEAEKINGQTKVTVLRRFSLGALLTNSYWYSSVATAEILCAIRTAAAQAGIGEVVATDACQSPLLTALLNRSATTLRSTAADPPVSGIDPLVQQSLQASADITEAPCDTDTPVGCLEPTSAVLQERQNAAKQIKTLPREEPSDAAILPPTGVSASDGLFSDHIQITWNPVAAGVTSYQVYRDYLSIGSSPTTSFEDSDVAPGLIYSYMIKACNSNECSSFSTADSGFVQTEQTTTYLVSTTAGSGGTISPSTRTVNQGANTSFTITPNSGYQIVSVTGCGGSLNGTTYTTSPITANCTVSASFSPISPTTTYLVSTTASSGGTINPSTRTVNQGANTSFTVTPNNGYQIVSVTGCGGSLNGTAYTTGPITANCTISASFSLVSPTTSYEVTATTTNFGGIISPASQTVNQGATASLMLNLNYGYQIASISGCDGSLNGTTYTTGPITANCTVTASFQVASYLVTATAGSGGTISPSSQTVSDGMTTSFTVTPSSDNYYPYIDSSNTSCGGNLSGGYPSYIYTTGSVTADCTVSINFVFD